ncbi:crystallin, gamma MX, like 2 [Synchiropus splendidus]|uniref:crystallin, gamma MX, like 2 n=1 Tax=Synchiropus splendidus TaxID=270530 RepID=UPI00237D7C82|nr:crystallin, gamma MX, like 2 [Synchiropus splendidus]
MGKIIFYEGRNFLGRKWECSTDTVDTFRHFKCCNSIQVTGGRWVAYEKPCYKGYQYILGQGDYPDYPCWMGFNNCIRSCQMIPTYRGEFKMRIYSRPDLTGHSMEFSDDCADIFDRLHIHDIHSCKVSEGFWVLYEHPHFRGRQYFLCPGEYKSFVDWGGSDPLVGSLRKIKS